MDNLILHSEPGIRLTGFVGIFVIMAAWEILAPRRPLQPSRMARWLNHIGLVVFNTLLLRLIFPLAAVGMAAHAWEQGWGLFNLSIWDRLFGTCRAQPVDGHTGMSIGIHTFRDSANCIHILGLLRMPFAGRVTDYAINRRSWSNPDG